MDTKNKFVEGVALLNEFKYAFEQSRAEQSRAEQSRAEQSRAERALIG